jgi:hypothetical protein
MLGAEATDDDPRMQVNVVKQGLDGGLQLFGGDDTGADSQDDEEDE